MCVERFPAKLLSQEHKPLGFTLVGGSLMDEAYGLDIAGYSTGGSGLAKAHRIRSGRFDVTIYSDHCFKVHPAEARATSTLTQSVV
jgi:hypothetical protein